MQEGSVMILEENRIVGYELYKMDTENQIKGKLQRAVQLKGWPWALAEGGVRQELHEKSSGEGVMSEDEKGEINT